MHKAFTYEKALLKYQLLDAELRGNILPMLGLSSQLASVGQTAFRLQPPCTASTQLAWETLQARIGKIDPLLLYSLDGGCASYGGGAPRDLTRGGGGRLECCW